MEHLKINLDIKIGIKTNLVMARSANQLQLIDETRDGLGGSARQRRRSISGYTSLAMVRVSKPGSVVQVRATLLAFSIPDSRIVSAHVRVFRWAAYIKD